MDSLMVPNKCWFLSFSDKRFLSSKRIRKEAEKSGFFDEVIVGNESMFEDWYCRKYKSRFKDRGFGYWQWKSYLIRRTFDMMDEGHFLVYADAGCTINTNGGKRLIEYFDLVSNSHCGILMFVQDKKDSEYTKGDVFSYLGLLNDMEARNHGQVMGSTIIMHKNKLSNEIINEWYYICHNKYDLLTDDPSVVPNYPEFIAHRHDQSVLSLLSFKYGFVELSGGEIYAEDWSTLRDYPIWETRYRNKKLPFLTRVYHFVKKEILGER